MSTCRRGAFHFLISSFIFSHDANATYEYCCTSGAALLPFRCWVLFGLPCVRPRLLAFVSFSSVSFSFVFPYVVEFSLFFLLFMSSGEIGRDAVPFRCCRWSSLVPFVLCVLPVKYL